MKVVILAGGFGSRLGDQTRDIPKPMVEIGNIPMIVHIMEHYSSFGFEEFVIALGYKGNVIKSYFLNYGQQNSDLEIDLARSTISQLKKHNKKWRIALVDTGIDSLTGRRLKRLEPLLIEDNFFLTYGDGLASVNIDELLRFHVAHQKEVTLTAVRPPARFGELEIVDNLVTNFEEKPQLSSGWINGGFFVFRRTFLKRLNDLNVMLEREPLVAASKSRELMAFTHQGFWQCVDTKKDLDHLRGLWDRGEKPWQT